MLSNWLIPTNNMAFARQKEITTCLARGDGVSAIKRKLTCSSGDIYGIKKKLATIETLMRKKRMHRNAIVTTRYIAGLKKQIKANTITTITKLAKAMGTMRESVCKGLALRGAKIRKRTKQQLLTQMAMQKQLEWCRVILNWLKSSKNAKKMLLFSDEKLFWVNATSPASNAYYITADEAKDLPASVRHCMTTKNPSGMMMFRVIAMTG